MNKEELEEVFVLFDRTGNGKIDVDQIKDVLRSTGLNPQGADLQKIEEDYKNKDAVEIAEFQAIYNEMKAKPQPAMEDFLEFFKLFDNEKSGCIDSLQLRGFLCMKGDSRLTEDELEVIVKEIEDKQKEAVPYKELITLVMSEPKSVE
ncbi:Myosin-2 essential light chain [Acropora cervicornis]|uniref:Myosin-2 essential light chain n=1 Tax=Acropora cervicornis TaxID=6130 RepID=A0AAD9QG26_ACRCE|nr:Myosin-2 essential light chain [Acropora cervicornis]